MFDPTIKVLTVRQPFAWLIVNGLKRIENRSRSTTHRGDLLILASVNPAPRADFEEARARCEALGITMPASYDQGGIVGIVRVTGCVTESSDPWFSGPVGWILEDGRPLPFVPAAGMLSLFTPSEDLLQRIYEKAQLPLF